VILRDLYFVCIAISPDEADPILIVDPNAVLPFPVAP